jgi:hypothetical protein
VREKLQTVLTELERTRFTGTLRIRFESGQAVEIERSQVEQLYVPEFTPHGPGGVPPERRFQ